MAKKKKFTLTGFKARLFLPVLFGLWAVVSIFSPLVALRCMDDFSKDVESKYNKAKGKSNE